MRIRTANDHQIVRRTGGYVRFVEHEATQRWRGARVNWETRGAVPAEIVRSNWCARCPYCPEAILVEPGHPFFCPNCLMASNGGCAMRLIMPAARAEIERLLVMRPVPENRNWLPHETLDMLRRENLEYGIGLPEHEE